MGELKREFISGILYTGAAKYIGIFISIIVSAILARLLSPSDFGIVAIATIFINFFSTLTTVGISPAIIQNKTISDKDLKEINSFTFIIAFVLAFVFLMSVSSITLFYDNSQLLKKVLYLLAISIFFSVSSIVPNAILLKDKEFKFIALRTFVVQLVLGVISVLGALCGMGVYSLLIGPIGSSIILFFINFHKRPIGLSRPHKSSVNKILSFSIYQMLFNLIYLLYRNIDKLVIGKFFGMTNLGYYEKSYRLMLMPLENVSSVLSPVLHPILSEYQTDKDYLWKVYKKMISFLSEFSFIISVVLCFLAEPIILLLYGKNWEPAVPIFRVLSLSICFQLIQAPVGAFFQSANRVKELMWSSLYLLILMIISVSVSVFLHNFNIFPALVLVTFFIGLILYEFFICRAYHKNISEILKVLFPHALNSFILFILLYATMMFIDNYDMIVKSLIYIIISVFFFFILVITNRVENSKIYLYNTIKKLFR